MKAPFAIEYSDVVAASERLQGHAHRTPVLNSSYVDRVTGAQVFFKCENLQRTGAFKFRGAFNAVARLSVPDRARGVLSYSSGNHAQALALAASLHHTKAVIVMPQDAPQIKVIATKNSGAEIVPYDRRTEQREDIALRIGKDRHLTLIPPFDHPDVMAGQGTACKELLEEVGPLDYLFVPVGGGGLLAGCAVAAAALSPGCKVIGVEPEAGNDAQQSFRLGKLVDIEMPMTIADGAQTTRMGELTFPIMQRYVHGMACVSDAQIVWSMQILAEQMKLIVEPTGCLGAAALLQCTSQTRDARVGVILSGGNIDLSTFGRLAACIA